MNSPEEQVPQAETTRAPKRWPLVSNLQTRDSTLPIQWGGRLVNAFAEADMGDKSYWVYKRPGMGTIAFTSAASAGAGLGSYTYNTNPYNPILLFVCGTTLYQTYQLGFPFPHFVTTPVGTVDSTSEYFFETINSSPQTVVLGNGVAAYVYNTSSQTITKITDANFPAYFVPGWVYLDGFLYIMDIVGKIWGTAGQNNALVWSGTNVILASSNADSGVALLKQLSYVVALKQFTSQVFYDAGNATGSPLGVVPDSQLPLGCFTGSSAQVIDNTLLWITTNQTVAPQVVQMDNLTPRVISTPSVERILSHATFTGQTLNPMLPGGVFSWTLKLGGHRYYGITLTAVSLNLTLVYDIDQKLWYIWTDVNGNYWPISSITFFPPYLLPNASYTAGVHLAQHVSNGSLYLLDSADIYPTDYGNIVPVDIYTANIDFGVIRRKMLRTLYFDGDKTSGSDIKVRFSDNDYQTWSNFRDVDLSLKKPRLGPCGTFDHRRAYHIRHQRATSFRLRDMDMQMDIGTL
jgi:hypothetical protein